MTARTHCKKGLKLPILCHAAAILVFVGRFLAIAPDLGLVHPVPVLLPVKLVNFPLLCIGDLV